jgi:chondroitin AC lyase
MRLCLILLALLPLLAVAAELPPADGLALVTRQLRELYLTVVPPANITATATALNADGAWPDVDYRSQQRSNWPTSLHLNRVQAMALAWARPETPAETKAALADAIHRALAYWAKHDLQCPNWWSNQIGVPQTLGIIALLLGDEMRPEETTYYTQTVLPRAKIGMTGQNRVWLAGNTLMGALVQRDAATVARAATVIFSEVVVSEKEGIQADASFHQHGPQQQFGNYGLAFANDIVKWAEVLRGSPWAMPAEQLAILRRYVLDGQRWIVWKDKADISACGRQLSPGSPVSKAKSVARVLAAMARVDPARAADYTAAPAGARVFWRSDYLVYRRPTGAATLRMCSTRTIGGESLNSENLSGYYLADGALYLYRTGDEYTDIFPAWNWRRVPGVTCAQEHGAMPKFHTITGKTTFVGGVTDGTTACAGLDYARDGVTAKKGYVFAGDTIVCLGAGIGATGDAPIATTLNQCLRHGPIRISTGGKIWEPGEEGQPLHPEMEWVEHDGFRYTFPQPQRVLLQYGPQSGSWRSVLDVTSVPKTPETRQVFVLGIEHDVRPKDAAYAYVISPAGTAPDVAVLANTPALQAVRVGTVVGIVFHAPGTCTIAPGRTLAADRPCCVLMDGDQLTVADPTHTLTALTLTLNGTTITVTLPTGASAGQSVAVQGR